MSKIETERLVLRDWRDSDIEPFAELNADSRVMEFFPKPLTSDETEQMVALVRQGIRENGFGFWAMELKATGELLGFTGLWKPGFQAHFTPCVEVGWRMHWRHWGKGYATEAARASLDFGFESLDLEEIVSFTVVGNHRSRKVMERLGMTHEPKDDFDHPNVPEGSSLKRHVLYRLKRS